MDEDFPDPGEYLDEYDAYEDKYADDLDMVDGMEEMEEIDFEVMNQKKKSRKDLDNTLLQDVLKDKLQKNKNEIDLFENNNIKKSKPVKRSCSPVLSDDEILEYSDEEFNEDSVKQTKSKKMKLEDTKTTPLQSNARIADLLKDLRSEINDDDVSHEISRKRVFRRPVLGEDSLNVTSTDGDRVFLKLHPDDECSKDESNRWQSKSTMDGLNLLSIPFNQLKVEVEEKRHNRHIERLEALSNNLQRNLDEAVSEKKTLELWVEKYTPKQYTELLSDDGTNRNLLKWLKLWDDIVFNTKTSNQKKKPKFNQDVYKDKNTTFQKYDYEDELVLDNKGRPKRKIALLCGNPGLGKTTLAHVISQHAGYNVVEMNASDDRSPELFLNKIEATTQMKAVIGVSKKPNCLIIDEIDGAPIQAINILLDLVKYTETASGKKKKRKKKEFFLNRPIICICNDQYVPALRQLRSVSFTLRFPPTLPSRLASRLLNISQLESLRIDMGALLLLADKAENDIRSCLNTLQFIYQRMKEFKPDDLRHMEVGQKDMKKGVRTILGEVFQLPRSKKKIYGTSGASTVVNPKTSAAARFYYMLHLISGNSEFEKMMQGLFDQYLNAKTKDPYLESVNLGCDWLGFSDIVEKRIQHSQMFVLRRFTTFLPVAFHMFFARAAAPKILYSNVAYENHLKTTHNIQTLQLHKNGMLPSLRRHCIQTICLLDLIPYLFLVTLPNLRPVNTKLYSESEKQMFSSLVDTMISYNLTYRQERNPEGQYTYMLEPNIEELTTFTGLPQHRHLPYATKQLIAREVDIEKMRRSERIFKPAEEENIGSAKKTRHKKEIKKIDISKDRPNLDFFGRIVQPDVQGSTTMVKKAEKTSLLNKKVWFRFNEGYTNAVRKTVKIKDFL